MYLKIKKMGFSNLFVFHFKRGSFICVLLALLSITANAQDEVWFFGVSGGSSAGLKFTGVGNAPVQFNGSSSRTFYESISVVSDGSGNQLFHSNGIKVYDASNTAMPNGSGLLGTDAGGGVASAVQGALTIQYPGTTDKYILFTVPAEDGTPANGMRYHVIDMTLPGNGTLLSPKGDVSSKNNLVHASATPMAEMLGAAKTAGSCNTVWVVGHKQGTADFVISKVTSSGVVSTVLQNIGPVVSAGGGSRGSIAFSPDGTKMALVGGWPTGSHIFDFNTTTGVISNHTDLSSKFVAGQQWRYGAEWSPDSKKLYMSNIWGLTDGIVQYNTLTTTLSSVVVGGTYGELVTGKDGKIYAGMNAGANLGVIATPNAATGGTAGFTTYASGATVGLGLPQTCMCAAIPCGDTTLAASIPNICTSNGTFDLDTYNGTSAAGTWTISGGPGGYTASISSGHTFNINNTTGGTYTVRHTLTTVGGGCPSYAERSFTIYSLPTVALTLTDDAACVSEAAFNLGGGTPLGGTYSGTGVGVSPSFNPGTAGVGSHTITYTYTDGNGCTNTATDAMTVNALPVVALTLTDDAACVDEAAFNLGGGTPLGGTYSGTGVGVSPSFNPGTAGVGSHTITYTYTDGNGCTNTATDAMTVNALPVVALTLTDDAACVDEAAFNLGGGTPLGGTYSGTGVGVSPSFNPGTAGVGSHTITYTYTDGNGCTNTATDAMTVNALPVVALTLTDDAACETESAFNLGGGTPLGGTYSGTGVGVSPSFDPVSAGVGSHTITYTYTDGNGCTSSATDLMTVNANPTTSIADTTICAGDVAGVFNAGAGFTNYAWSGNGTGTSQTTARTVAGVYNVTVTDANGCSFSTSATLFINAKPNISVADTTICAGDVAGVFDAGAGFTTYAWSVNGTGTAQTTTRTVAGVYTVQVVDANGCKDTTSATLFINAKPNISVADTTICAGDVAGVFDAGAGFTTYNWTGNGTGTAQTTARTVAGVYTVNVVDANGCKDTTSATLFINAKPNISIADTSICAGDVAGVFDAGAGFSTYVWSGNGTGTSRTTARTIMGIYTVRVVDANGCKDTTSTFLNINAKPNITIADTTICAGDVAGVFDAGSGFAGYSWTDNGSGNARTTARTVAGKYTVRVIDANGCKDTTSTYLYINAKPNITVADTTICVGDVAGVFDAGAGFSSYSWTGNGSGASRTTARTIAGVYTVIVVDANGCKDTTSATLNINAKPVAAITTINDVCVNKSGTAALVASPTGGVWKLDGSSNQGQLTLGSMAAGIHNVVYYYSDNNACKDTANASFEVFDTNQVNLPTSAAYCQGKSYVFTLPNLWSTYKWNNVVGSNSYTVSNGTQAVAVEVTDANGCITQDISAVTENPYPTPDLGSDIELCQGQSATLDPGTANNLNYSWTPGNAYSPTLVVSTSAVYKVVVTDGIGCAGSDSVKVVVHQLPKVSLGADTSMCDNGYERIVLNAYYTGTMKTLWSTYEKNVDSIKIGLIGDYWIQVTDSNSCVNKDTITVVHKCPDFKFTWPNVFTPNTDGYNDEFLPIGVNDASFMSIVANLEKVHFEVYDRWGIKMYESVNVIPRWDGTFNGSVLDSGTFYWIVTYTNSAGRTYEDKGFVSLIK